MPFCLDIKAHAKHEEPHDDDRHIDDILDAHIMEIHLDKYENADGADHPIKRLDHFQYIHVLPPKPYRIYLNIDSRFVQPLILSCLPERENDKETVARIISINMQQDAVLEQIY